MTVLGSVLVNLGSAWAAGSLIGLERSYNGRMAGLRTHGLVALASAVVVNLSLEPLLLPGAFDPGVTHLDPTRLAQGVMTGVGFLGAGVIFKEGVSIQGLTTAASIWLTSAIGLALGLGLAVPGWCATLAALVILAALRWVEAFLPSKTLALATITFTVAEAPGEPEFVALLAAHRITAAEISYRLAADETFEFRASLASEGRGAFAELAGALRRTPGLKAFDLSRVSK